jgi:ATP-dependent helicase HrpB
MTSLPIDPLLGEITRTLSTAGVLVLEAEPGAGKSTRVPVALMDAGLADKGEILVSEPRRLAARLVAHFVAGERGERAGESIGYSVRFEDVSGPATRVRYVTEGILIRRLLQDPELRGVRAVVLDEFHERSLSTDLALALLSRLRRGKRPDLALVVMSATLDADPIARLLDSPRLRSEGRTFPLTIEHAARPDDRPLDKQVVSAVRRAIAEEPEGDVLVFLPGAGDIRRARDALAGLAQSEHLALCPLHGDLSVDEQARAVSRQSQRKVVLSTNVAETSVTIDGVTTVIDSGLARSATHSPWTGLPRLETVKISRASATQRAGRAGRTRAGRVIRLYTAGDLATRPEHDAPEIQRADLSEAVLTLWGAEIRDARQLSWLDAPPAQALSSAENLLDLLGARRDGQLSPIGRRMLSFPLHPRLARLVVEGERRGVAGRACLAAALLSERDIRLAARTRFDDGRALDGARGKSDVLELMDRFDEAKDARFDQRLRNMGIDARGARSVERARSQLARIAKDAAPAPSSLELEEDAIRMAILSAYPDRVAKRARGGQNDLVLSGGGVAKLAESSVVCDAQLVVAVDVEDRRGAAQVRLASAIDPEWLLDLFPERLTESETLELNPDKRRIERSSKLAYGSVVLDETRRVAEPSPAAAALLAKAALAPGSTFQGMERLDQLVTRIELLRRELPETQLPDLGADAARGALERAAETLVSFDELEQANLVELVLAGFSREEQKLLREEAPERVTLPGGRSLEVHYERDRPPWVESRLQDFFGSKSGPAICRGRVFLTLHLLAPNARAVQVTSDLAGFWQRHYPSVRKELMRKYPRHLWPEDGATARPPEPRPPRKR